MTLKNQFSAKAMILVLTLFLSQWSFAAPPSGAADERPSALAMTGDLLIVRPVMFGITAVGSVLWLLSLPAAAAGGNVKQTTRTLVLRPGANTFVRCLGCTRPGYRQGDEQGY